MFTPSDVNAERINTHIAALYELGRNEATNGITRYTFSEEHQKATELTRQWMSDAGLQTAYDKWGNLYGRVRGFDDGEKCVMSGSHLDSVPNGGNYDGPLGVLSALEAVQLIVERGVSLKKPLEVVSFIEEEGARFHGLLGSTLATNQLHQPVGNLVDTLGNRFVDVLAGLNLPVEREDDLTERVAAYVELHIEQGKRLEKAQTPIGVVTSIAGPTFLTVTIKGRSDHAGATDYQDRQDTLLAAAEMVVAVREMGVGRFVDGGRMTVGKLNPRPNVTNVVAGETSFDIDFRAATIEIMQEMNDAIRLELERICSKHGVTYTIEVGHSVEPAPAPPHIQLAIEQGAAQAGIKHMSLVSWAAHDAMLMANVTDSGMIFVPCKDGRSHTPEEYVSPEDIAAGVAALANTLVVLGNN